jgi:hypothetical protein
MPCPLKPTILFSVGTRQCRVLLNLQSAVNEINRGRCLQLVLPTVLHWRQQ